MVVSTFHPSFHPKVVLSLLQSNLRKLASCGSPSCLFTYAALLNTESEPSSPTVPFHLSQNNCTSLPVVQQSLSSVQYFYFLPQQRLYFFPLPQIHGSFGYIFFLLFCTKNCSVLRSTISLPNAFNSALLISGISF